MDARRASYMGGQRRGHGPRAALALAVFTAGLAAGCSFDRGPRFQHVSHAGAGLTCTSCHDTLFAAGDKAPVPQTRGPVEVAENRCVSCHKAPHPGKTYVGACARCHGDATRHAKKTEASHILFDHKRHAPRVKGQCFPCHRAAATRAGSHDGLLPTMATCNTCHQKDYDAMACGLCHERLDVFPIQPVSQFSHQGNFLRLHGKIAASRPESCAQCHQQPFCAGCHDPKGQPIRLDLRWPTDIEKGFIHRGDYVGRHAVEARASGDTCLRCHNQQQECAACHDRRGFGQGAGRNPHPPGWVSVTGGPNLHGRAARREIVACAGCHDQGAASNCVGCHRVGGVGGTPHPPGFRSRLSKAKDHVCRVCH